MLAAAAEGGDVEVVGAGEQGNENEQKERLPELYWGPDQTRFILVFNRRMVREGGEGTTV